MITESITIKVQSLFIWSSFSWLTLIFINFLSPFRPNFLSFFLLFSHLKFYQSSSSSIILVHLSTFLPNGIRIKPMKIIARFNLKVHYIIFKEKGEVQLLLSQKKQYFHPLPPHFLTSSQYFRAFNWWWINKKQNFI